MHVWVQNSYSKVLWPLSLNWTVCLQWHLYKLNLLWTNLCVCIRQVFGLYRLNQQRLPTLGLDLKLGLHRILFYSRFTQDSVLFKVYTGFWFIQGLHRILLYSRFTQDSALFKVYTGFCFFQGLHRILFYSRFTQDSVLFKVYIGFCFIQGLHSILFYSRFTSGVPIIGNID